jgi:hypothetical protein
MKFHSQVQDEYAYSIKPNMAFRRFIFYPNSKNDTKLPVDNETYLKTVALLERHIQRDDDGNPKEVLWAIQDLFLGYSAVLKNRTWSAKTLLPISKSLIFCEAMPSAKKRSQLLDDGSVDFYKDVEMKFDFDKHNFLARGGATYYLHILEYLQTYDIDGTQRQTLETLLIHLITSKTKVFDNLANWIQSTWEKENGLDELNPKSLYVNIKMEYIPKGIYLDCAKYTVEELICYLSNEIHPITKVEVLSIGVAFQVMRMLCTSASKCIAQERVPFIVDMKDEKSSKVVRQLSMKSFQAVEEQFVTAINKVADEEYSNDEIQKKIPRTKNVYKAKSETADSFKFYGKQMGFITNTYERFTMSESLVKFLVLSLVKPNHKISYRTFLSLLYEHYGIIVSSEEYRRCTQTKLDFEHSNVLDNNSLAFQRLLKNAGFLKTLSDATSIIVNPYTKVEA